MSSHDYPDVAKSERKDALIPHLQEFDFSDPDKPLSAKNRIRMFSKVRQNTRREVQKHSPVFYV